MPVCRQEDVQAYFNGIFEFAGVAMTAARNPMLKQMLIELWPNNRRIQYASLADRKADLKRNQQYFRHMAKYASEGDAENAAAVIIQYARNEKKFALRIINERIDAPKS